MVVAVMEYIEQNLGHWILTDPEFTDKYDVVSCSAKASDHLDGFMAKILMCDLVLKKKADETLREVPLVVKVMKGDKEFRDSSKSFIQCRNEVYIYEKVIPYFKRFISTRSSCSIDAEQWTPKVYRAFYGIIPELGDFEESVLVMENLSVSGFKGGPRLELDMNHLTIMVRTIAQYHSVQYAMRIEKDPELDNLKSKIVPCLWRDPGETTTNVFDVVYQAAFQRMFDYLDRNPDMYNSPQMTEEVGLLRKYYGEDPIALMDRFIEDDKAFSVIQHGDYNRNNVLFQYGGVEEPKALRMFDFQECRYGSPCFDLFFFFYMSTTAELRERHWDDLLQMYHSQVWQHLKELLNCTDSDPRLDQYSFANFQKHFARFAFYGTMVTIHFLPWMDCSTEEAEMLSTEFTKDMKSQKFKEVLLIAGGDASNKKVALALQHACNRGYLSFIKEV